MTIEWITDWLGDVPSPESPPASFLGTMPRGFFEEGTLGRCDDASPAFVRGLLMPRAEYDSLPIQQKTSIFLTPRWTLYGGPIQTRALAREWDTYLNFWAASAGLIWISYPDSTPCIVASHRLPWPANTTTSWTWVRELEPPRRVVYNPSTQKYVWEAPGNFGVSGLLGQVTAPPGWPAGWDWPIPTGWAPPGWPAGIQFPPITPTGAPPLAWETTGLPWPPPEWLWPSSWPLTPPPGLSIPNVLGPPLTAPVDPPVPSVPAGWPVDVAWPLPPDCWPAGTPFPPPAPFWWPKDAAWPPLPADLLTKPAWWPSNLAAWPPNLSAIPGWPTNCPFPVALPTTPPPQPPVTGPLPPPPPPIQDEVPAAPGVPAPGPSPAPRRGGGAIVVGGLIAAAIAIAAAFAGD